MGHAQERFAADLISILPRLKQFAYGLTGCEEDGADLVQSACERGLTHRHQWQADKSLEGWMMAIMQSLWKNQLRARKVRLGNGLVDPETHLVFDGADRMNGWLRGREVAAALQQLTADQQRLLRLVHIEGHSYREAAALLDIPLGTVMSRLARARLALADRIAEGGLPAARPCDRQKAGTGRDL